MTDRDRAWDAEHHRAALQIITEADRFLRLSEQQLKAGRLMDARETVRTVRGLMPPLERAIQRRPVRAEQPIVRTVGDLTPRHRGKRVRVKASISDGRPACRGRWIIGTLDEIFVEVGELGLNLDAARIEGSAYIDPWSPYLAYGTDELDSPCEVLP